MKDRLQNWQAVVVPSNCNELKYNKGNKYFLHYFLSSKVVNFYHLRVN